MNVATLGARLGSAAIGVDSWRHVPAATSAPATPNIAPDAPAPTINGWTSRLVVLPAIPLRRYRSRNEPRPNTRSAIGPRATKHHMFKARWSRSEEHTSELQSRGH